MSLPNPGQDAVPFTTLTAQFYDETIENIEALADGSGLDDGAVGPAKRSGGYYALVHDFGSGTGSVSITSVPFQPRALTVMAIDNDSAIGAYNANGYAVDTSPIVQGGSFSTFTSSGPAFSTVKSSSACFISVQPGSLTPRFSASVTSFNSNGITVNKTTGNASAVNRTFHIVFQA